MENLKLVATVTTICISTMYVFVHHVLLQHLCRVEQVILRGQPWGRQVLHMVPAQVFQIMVFGTRLRAMVHEQPYPPPPHLTMRWTYSVVRAVV